jgi:hypothetical protein
MINLNVDLINQIHHPSSIIHHASRMMMRGLIHIISVHIILLSSPTLHPHARAELKPSIIAVVPYYFSCFTIHITCIKTNTQTPKHQTPNAVPSNFLSIDDN